MYGIVPFKRHGLASIFKGFDDMVKRDWYGLPWAELSSEFDQEWLPPIDLSETKEAVTAKIELPGLEKKDIDLSVDKGILTITGEKKEEKEETDKHFHRVECSYGGFVRTVALPAEVKKDKIDATFKDGILTVTLPKVKEEVKKVTRVKIDGLEKSPSYRFVMAK